MRRATFMLAGAALAILVCGGAASASAVEVVSGRHLLQSITEFPPLCKCDRDPLHSPYRLIPDAPTSTTKYNEYCFTIDNSIKCDTKEKCCNGKQGVEKVEFDVVDACKDSLKTVTVDGKKVSFEYNTKLNVLRVTNLDLSASEAPGTKICLQLQKVPATCSTIGQLCGGRSGGCKYAIFNKDRDCCPVHQTSGSPPPPQAPGFGRPPPPPPPTFPFCNCVRNTSESRLVPTRSTVGPLGNMTKICFKVDVKSSCSAGSKCCQFTLFKLEIDANPACKDSLVYSTLDGQRRVRFFQTNPYPAIKVNNINKPFSSVDGTEVCLIMRGGCDSISELCNGSKCTVSLFNKPGSNPSCCPTAAV